MRVDRLIERSCVWVCLFGLVVFFAGLLQADLLPPLSPDDTAQEIADHWRSDTDAKRFGLLLITLGGMMIGPFIGVITTQMKRIRPGLAPLAYLQLGAGFLLVLAFIGPAYIMAAEAFRPGRETSEILLANDIAWILFVGMFPPFFAQCMAIAVAAFVDEEGAVFPRWLGYFNIWVALIFLPAALIFFFKTGPFAWDGLFPFWIALADIGAWFCVMSWVMLRNADA